MYKRQTLNMELNPYTRYYVRVMVETDENETAVSETVYFETAKMEENWSAEWIGVQDEDKFHPEFQKTFLAEKEVKKARLYITGLGLFEAYLNGEKTGTDFLAPFVNDYKDCLLYTSRCV